MDAADRSAEDGDAPMERARGASTLNTLYHETRQETELLHRQVRVKDNIIADLKARLGRYERVYVSAGDGVGSVALGPSRSLLESLCAEMCKLKQRRSDAQLRASRLEEPRRPQLRVAPALLQFAHLRAQALQQGPGRPERHGADAVARRHVDALVAAQPRLQVGDDVVLDADLPVEQLRLLARLVVQRVQRAGAARSLHRRVAVLRAPTAESSDVSGVNAQVLQLQEENKQLKQRVAYVQGLNSQWQKYDSSREDYIRGLCQRLKESTGQGLLPGLGSVTTGLLHQEISRLNGLLEGKMSECARLGIEVEEIRRHDQERIQTLEQQVLIYTEDFKSERTDRERAQGHIQDLKEQVYQLKQQLHKQGATRETRDVVPMCRVHIGHRISSRRHKDNTEHLLRTTAETQQQPVAAAAEAAATTPSPAWSDILLGLSELQCPRCQAKFSDTDTAEYLKHWEECAKL
ncbi:putative TNFAIP3-interacting protein 2 [Scophthalmus maximus]|uniref:TNFAIP3-interacting protein 2 n=1 Tax=Scophthalmus maximus TaxID=52904 RepID=A0A2U9BMS3_SCOMX|nr:putative TNFAIP3-interacting protein 2 [Scophthalmus maximus]